MGCDIHFYVERRVDGVWATADKWTNEHGYKHVPYADEFYSDRSYGLFAVLAGVRNSHDVTPIAEPRGVPADACPEYLEASGDGDGHSHSYFTVAELLAFDWTQTITYTGVVNPSAWARLRDYPAEGPSDWSVSVGGGNVRHYTPEQFEAAWVTLRERRGYPEVRHASAHLRPAHGGNADLDEFTAILSQGQDVSPYTTVQWAAPYYRPAAGFWSKTMPRMLALGAPDDVRCCFFFDN